MLGKTHKYQMSWRNPSNGIRALPFRQTDVRTDVQTNMTKVIVSEILRTRFKQILLNFVKLTNLTSRSQRPPGLRRRSTVVRLLGSWVRIPPGACLSVSCECCVLSGRGLCDELIIRPEESYWVWCVVVCDLETPWTKRPWPTKGRSATGGKKIN